jgi:hypothetical protein
MAIQRCWCIVVSDEKGAYWRRWQGVGERDEAPAVDGDVRSDVVEDGGPPGSSGVSGEGSNRRRRLRQLAGLRRAIGGLR